MIKRDECKKVKYKKVWQAMKEHEEGESLFTRQSNDNLILITSPEDVVRYFHDLYKRN